MLHPHIDMEAKEGLIVKLKYYASSSTPVLLLAGISTLISKNGWWCYFKFNMWSNSAVIKSEIYVSALITASVLVCPGEISFLHPLHLLLKISHLLQQKTYQRGCQPGCVTYETNTPDRFLTALKIWRIHFTETVINGSFK